MKHADMLFANLLVALLLAGASYPAAARLPAPVETAESKAQAQEAAAKAAAAAKREAEDLSRYMDKAVDNYKQRQAK